MTAVALSELIGVSKQAVSQYETGKQTPHPDVMGEICNKLNLPLGFFLRPLPAEDDSPEFFRCNSAATKAAQAKARCRLFWLRDIVSYVSKLVALPSVDLPRVDLPDDPAALSGGQIESIAEQTRRHWKMGDGPISNVIWLLENHGIPVTRINLEADKLDGLSRWFRIDGRPYVVLAADKGCAVRSRFDAAHELGHILLHRNVDTKRLKNAAQFSLLENQAHRFAAAFLLPQRSFAADCSWPTLDSFRQRKEKWRVSIGMMIMRAEHLRFITEEQKTSMFISYSRRGWKRKEPLDDSLPVEQPRLLLQAMELILNAGARSRDDIRAGLPFARTDIEELSGLPRGFLSDEQATIIHLKMHEAKRPADQPRPNSPHDEGADIIAFPGTVRR